MNDESSTNSFFTCIKPDYLSRFKCDGTLCDSRCCRDWSVAVDKATYEMYSAIKPESRRSGILSKISPTEGQYPYKMNLDERGR